MASTKKQRTTAPKSKRTGGKAGAKAGTAKRTAARPAPAPPPAAAETSPPAHRPRKERARPSGLDAAAAVLAEAGGPMRCGDLAKLILERGLWTTSGRTPAATINAAIIREIRAKGERSRFRRAGRGLFVSAPSAG